MVIRPKHVAVKFVVRILLRVLGQVQGFRYMFQSYDHLQDEICIYFIYI
jgi:hypothetical protein